MRSWNGISRRALSLAAFGMVFVAGAASAQTAPFTDWSSALKAGATVAVGGIGMESTLVSGPGGVTSVGAASGTLDLIFEESLSAQGDISSISTLR